MKFSTVFIVLTAVATVSAARVDTNAYRMARGLPPKAPTQRSTPALAAAKRGTPSGVPPPQCKPALESCSGPTECCSEICLLGLCI
ncbi:60S ribosomal protein L27-A [Mycena venus]|uniref:60S ribosomal protein L27-A n=1 Tax=Mycena venus TaxID=2733690 RepID=A0A8H7DCW0_9AGAR|nr:60S ribosomal protein L27-A [Mycena venus]